MRQLSFQYFSPSKLLLVLALAHLLPLSSLEAMDSPSTGDPIHDNVLQTLLKKQGFRPDHFIEKQDTIPLYDVALASSGECPLKRHIESRAQEMHPENLKDFQKSCLSSQLVQSGIPLDDASKISVSLLGDLGSNHYNPPIYSSLSDTMTPAEGSTSNLWRYLAYPGYLLEMIKSNMPRLSLPHFSYFSKPAPSNNTPTNILEGSSLEDEFELIEDTSRNTPEIDTTSQDFSTRS